MDEIDQHPDGHEIPVRVIEREVETKAPNGTVVEIEQIFLRKIDLSSMQRYIERQIAHWPNATVFINHHECVVPDASIIETVHCKDRFIWSFKKTFSILGVEPGDILILEFEFGEHHVLVKAGGQGLLSAVQEYSGVEVPDTSSSMETENS